MPNARTDFYLTIDRAANAVLDAQCAARSAARGPLPHPHRRLMGRALEALDTAAVAMWKARNDPWTPERPKGPVQMELL